MKKYLGVLFGLMGLLACDSLKQEVNPAGIDAGVEKLVVVCFISPQDTVLTAEVALSYPVLGEVNRAGYRVNNATITLSEGDRDIVLERRDGKYPGQYYYGADPKKFPIETGHTYRLTVQIPDGRKVEAVCQVPKALVARDIVLDSIQVVEKGLSGNDYFVRLRWQDPAGEPNYYRYAGVFKYLPVGFSFPNAPKPSWSSNFIDFRQDNDERELVDDQQHDGEMLSSSRGFIRFYGNDPVPLSQRVEQLECEIDLLHTDANYYRYHQAIQRKEQVRGNPFAEPVLVPTNISGGLGCFGAYNRSRIIVELL
jgi:hypothetical protein